MTAYAQHDSGFLSRRTTAFFLIALLHAVLIYLFANGLVRTLIQETPPAIDATFLPNHPTPAIPPPPPEPTLALPGVELPKPDLAFELQMDDETFRDVLPAQVPSPPSPPGVVNRVLGGPGAGFPHTNDYYPAAAIRLGERGVVTVRVCVDGDGRLTADPTVALSSGSPRLDEGSLKLAKVGSGHYRPTTEDGRPVSSCYPFRIRFDFMH